MLAVLVIIAVGCGTYFYVKFDRMMDSIIVDSENDPEGIVAEEYVPGDPVIIYLSGSDTRDDELDEETRSDVNILVVLNPKTNKILLVNTPRDYYVENPAYGNTKDKLTHCGNAGVANSIKVLENLYDIKIDYYCKINFTGFETLVDTVGGVDIINDEAFSTGKFYFQEGENHLNGTQALAFARNRHNVSGGDFGRGNHQMLIIKALIEKITSSKTILLNYSEILDDLTGTFTMNVPKNLISNVVKGQLTTFATWSVETFNTTGSVGWATIAGGVERSVVFQDEEKIAEAKQLIANTLAVE